MFYFLLVIRALLIWIGFINLFAGEYYLLLSIILTFVLTFAGKIIDKIFKFRLSIISELTLIIFVFSSTYLGNVMDFYNQYWWWDSYLHFFSGIIMVMVAFDFLKKFNNLTISSKIVVAILFGISLATLWEVFEFSVDTIFKMNLQRWKEVKIDNDIGIIKRGPGLIDTMKDLILGTLGSLITGIIYLFNQIKKQIIIKV